MIIEYTVVKKPEAEFEVAVNELIAQGWQPYGFPTFMTRGLSGHSLEVFQVMVREEPIEPTQP